MRRQAVEVESDPSWAGVYTIGGWCALLTLLVALLDLVLTIYAKGVELVEIGVPVQELTGLPLLARARRLKQTYGSEQVKELREFMDEIRTQFDRIRLEYGKFQEHAAT